jgi:colanic acid biosynthesis glycosyl transferase WcaI
VKILVYGINYVPELTGIGKYNGEMATWLAAQGHEIRVVAAPPYYPDWKLGSGYTGMEYRRESIDGVEIWRCPLYVPARPSGLKRILHLMTFGVSSFPIMLRQILWRPDLVWVAEPPLLCAPTTWIVARLCDARCWLHIQDFEVDAAFELGLVKGKTARRVIGAMERWIMRRFDRVSTISRNMLKRLEAKGIPNGVMFRNWVDIQVIHPMAAPSSFRAELGIKDNTIVAMYSGNMGRKQGLEVLAAAAKCFAEPTIATDGLLRPEDQKIMFVFCGVGAGGADLEEACAGLENVRFLDLQPTERLNELLNLADIHLLPQRANAADLVMPSKLTGMMASGRPTIATAQEGTEIAQVLEDSGFIVPPGDVAAFCEKLARLAGNKKLREKMGKAARRYAEEVLAKESVLNRFREELEACVDGK